MTRQPNLFILGAPKCGTTSLVNWFEQHSQVFVPRVKEPHHYNRDERQIYYPKRNDYLDLFIGGESAAYRLDASVWYLHSRVAVPEIMKDCPNARFLVCLRNPVDMAFSLYTQYRNKTGREDAGSFELAWSLSEKRLKGDCVSSLASEPAYLAYKYSCRIGTQSERLLASVPREQVEFVVLDDLIKAPQDTLRSIVSFLRISEDVRLEVPHENAAISLRSLALHRVLVRLSEARQRSGLKRLPSPVRQLSARLRDANTSTAKPRMRPDTRRLVTEYFLDEIRSVWRIRGREYPDWVKCLGGTSAETSESHTSY